ncbi:hypothetical protein [Haloarcula sp. CBA1127]|uniref:hypothetical protein n=1 Tax=Haloarcula sp. CBA1127 TaxID=1765055 RepID=UPI0012AB498E|nr:hypothetical protein [Haloarcula sp. CBA1127]
MNPDRRQILQSIASSTVVGVGLSQIAAPGAAKETSHEKDKLSITKLSGQEAKQLRTELLSTGPVETVREKIESDDFKAEVEEHTVAAEIMNEDTDEQWSALRLGFSYTGEATDNEDHGAILYVHKKDGIASVRGISQHEGESVKVHEAQGSASRFTMSETGQASTYTVPVVDGGDA